MTTTPTKALTTAELARHLGSKVRYQFLFLAEQSQGSVTTEFLIDHERGRVDNVQLFLKTLKLITKEECHSLLKVALSDADVEIIDANPNTDFEDIIGIDINGRDSTISIWEDGRIGIIEYKTLYPKAINAVAVINYLREKGYDIDGLIKSGAALPAQP